MRGSAWWVSPGYVFHGKKKKKAKKRESTWRAALIFLYA
jgi:hypothetical protein